MAALPVLLCPRPGHHPGLLIKQVAYKTNQADVSKPYSKNVTGGNIVNSESNSK